jgi:hypothetical protein
MSYSNKISEHPMIEKKIWIIAIWILVMGATFIGETAFGQSKVGTTAVPFLGISVGPRATALGGAFAGISDDATSLYYNPGGFSRVGKSQILFSHSNWLVGSNFNWIGFVFRMNDANAIGLSVTQLDYGEEEVTTVLQPEGTGESWSAMDFAAAFSYGRNLTDRFSIGGSVKYIQQKLWNEKASAFAMDIGLLFVTDFNGMRLGMSISNFGTDMKMEGKDLLRRIDLDPDHLGNNETIVANLKTDSWPLPLFFRVGVAMDVLRAGKNRLTIAADAVRPSDNTETINIGSEMAFYDTFFIRGGYKSLFRESSEEGLTLGAGTRLLWSGRQSVAVDYTFADFGLFEDIHMISIGIGF